MKVLVLLAEAVDPVARAARLDKISVVVNKLSRHMDRFGNRSNGLKRTKNYGPNSALYTAKPTWRGNTIAASALHNYAKAKFHKALGVRHRSDNVRHDMKTVGPLVNGLKHLAGKEFKARSSRNNFKKQPEVSNFAIPNPVWIKPKDKQ